MDATDAYTHFVENPEALTGIPQDVLQTAQEAAQAENKTGWKFTLHFPSYMPVLQYAENRELRETLYRAYATRSSEFGKPELDNTTLISEILQLRLEAAQLLGFANFSEMSLATKMADTPQQVIAFLDTLAKRAKPFAERDIQEVREYGKKLGLTDLQAWDIAFVSEKLREEKYAFSDQEVKQYFPEEQVLHGLFKVTETIFGVHVKKSQAPAWHQNVDFYEITDKHGKLVGQFYLDLYARNNKRGGAWMDEAITRRKKSHGIETPVAFLTCNFPHPLATNPHSLPMMKSTPCSMSSVTGCTIC